MKFRLIFIFAIGFFIFNSLTYTHAQKRIVKWDGDEMPDTSHKENEDSARIARAHIADSTKDAVSHAADSVKAARKFAMDSTRDARARIADSTKLAREQKSDSLKDARKHITDSTARVRKYRDSKHYRDSVSNARLAKTNALKEAREGHMDSVTEARKHVTDSLMAMRKAKTDSIHAVQKTRSDSLARIKKYKTSKRYADSVSLVRRDRMESIEKARQKTRDSLSAYRKHILDSSKVARKRVTDSIKVVRTKYIDSIKLVRKARTDSLAKIKKQKEELAKAKEKKKEENMKLKLELKMKEKHEAWSNKSMLKKPFTPVRRVTQNSFTHYNYYYNANRKMEEALLNMQRSRKENYDSLIGLYPYDPNRDSSMMLADMDSIVRKVSVGIQIHDPRVKWSNDLYLLLGEAYYYKGSYNYAAVAFRYIISKDEAEKKKQAAKNGYGANKSKDAPSIMEEEKKSKLDFLKHKSVHNESILWLARTFTEAHQAENAESILSLLESDTKLPDNLKGRLAIEKAFAYLTENNLAAAGNQLAIAVDDNNIPTWLRMRAAFLHGQILQNMGQYNDAANSFAKVLTYFPKIEMDFYSRKYVAFNKLLAGEEIEEAMKPLKKVLNDGKYVNYYDQVYFVLGQLAAKANKTDLAVSYYEKSVSTPKASKKQKALSFAAMGDVYYASASYVNAKIAYDSAEKYSSGVKDVALKTAAQRNKGLVEITGPSTIIHDEDSLLELSAMSKKEQQSVVRKYLKYLEKLRDDSISNAQNSDVAAAVPDPDNQSKDDWYFSNPTLVQQGSEDFKKKWGTRPLMDNWRRASAIAFSDNSDNGEDGSGGATEKENGLPTEASLLAKIPNTSAQKDQATKLEEKAYIFLAKAYVKQLEDYKLAIETLDTLDIRYPNHNQKEEELYLRYDIAVKQDNLPLAQKYSDELIAKFPDSKYAALLRPRHSESKADNLVDGKTVSAYFDETYALVMQHQYTEALMNINTAQKKFDDSVDKKRFQVLEASAYAGMGDYNQGDTLIKAFLHKNPSDSLVGWATSVRQYIKEVRNGGKPSWYYDTLTDAEKTLLAKKNIKSQNVTPLVQPQQKSDIPPIYSFRADTQHYCIIVLPGLDSRTAGLKKGIKAFDSSNYGTAGLEMLMDFYNIKQDVLIIKTFANEAKAQKYMDALKTSDAVKGYKDGELSILIISTANYKKMFSDKTAQPYFSFFNTYYK